MSSQSLAPTMPPASNQQSTEPRLVGYARVSTDDQDLALQVDALTKQGIPKSSIFIDKLSGAKTDRPGLAKCLAALQSGDILVVWRLDRLGRSMRHLITLVEDLRKKGIGFPSRLVQSIRIRSSRTMSVGFESLPCRSALPTLSESTQGRKP